MFLDTDFLRGDGIWLRLEHTVDADPMRQWLPTYHFEICLPDGVKVGRCDLRIGHNELTYYGGNIGYEVDAEYRGHHYAGRACRLLFELARRHGLDYLYITCNPENIASARTCEYAGGVLEAIADVPEYNDMYAEGETRKRIYRFEL